MDKRIKVEVGPGMFSTERSVSFSTGTRRYSLLVDASDIVEPNMLRVNLVAQYPDESLVELPRETFTTGSRIRVPNTLVK